jgi:dipeptidyl aminopeptidase/acylaminoacyl peptidase
MAHTSKLLTGDTLWKLDRVGSVALAPDGAQAVCSVGSHDMEANTGKTSLWLLSTFGGGPRRLTTCGEKDGQPAWSPTGDCIAFVGRRAQQGSKDERAQLYVIAPDGGEARRVSQFAPGVETFKWFPDGKRIAFVAWVWPELKGAKAQAKRFKEFKERKETGYATSECQYRYWDQNLPMGRVPHLHVLDVASGRVSDLFEGSDFELPRAETSANDFDIAPDGRHIVFAFDPNKTKRIDQCKTLAELNLRSGKIATLLHETSWNFEAPRYSPDGSRIAFAANQQGKHHTLPAHAAVLQRGARWRVLSDTWDRSINAPLRWSADGNALFFTAEDRGRCNLYRYSIDSHTAGVVTQGGWVQGFDVAADVVVTAADSMEHPARVHAQRGGEAPRRLERFNDAALTGLTLGSHEEVWFKGALGDKVQMWLVFPPGFDRKKASKNASEKGSDKGSEKRWPLLHVIHGGPHAAAGDTFHYRWNTQAFAAQGYVVASVNYHGSSGFGHGFLDSITHRFGELELQDLEAATDWLLSRPWADKKRVFASGGSYGGYLVAWMNGRAKPGRYNAYICHAGCFDWTAMFADDAYTWFPRELGASYWDDMAKVLAQSPHNFVKTMATPTLVVHGALDYRVPDAQGLAHYNTLKAKGVAARLLWFPDENHWILKPRNSRLWYQEFFDWLRAHDPGLAPKRVGRKR